MSLLHLKKKTSIKAGSIVVSIFLNLAHLCQHSRSQQKQVDHNRPWHKDLPIIVNQTEIFARRNKSIFRGKYGKKKKKIGLQNPLN